MELSIIIVFIIYIFLLIWLMVGWRRAIMPKTTRASANKPFVSIVVPVRNEASVIANLVYDLGQQTYSHFEIIVVDDHSEDETMNVLLSASEKSPQLKKQLTLLTCSEKLGKKAALTLGIGSAKGEIILTTDADCRVDKEWVQSTVACFDDTTNLVIGAVRLSAQNFFDKLQQLEFVSLIGSGAATLGWNFPSMANGANLAFRKNAFEKVRGYTGNEHIPSGDDEFLLRKIATLFPNSILFNAHTNAIVETRPSSSFHAFVQQRLRWAGKWRLHKGVFSKVLAVSIFLFQVCFLLLPWFIAFNQVFWQIGLTLWLSKALFEYSFFQMLVRKLGVSFSWKAFLILQFIYPYYVVAIGLLANGSTYEWRGRKY